MAWVERRPDDRRARRRLDAVDKRILARDRVHHDLPKPSPATRDIIVQIGVSYSDLQDIRIGSEPIDTSSLDPGDFKPTVVNISQPYKDILDRWIADHGGRLPIGLERSRAKQVRPNKSIA